MDEDNGIIYDDDMKDLRTKTFNEEGVVKFNKHLFGGFKKEEVENYINSLNEQFSRTEQAYKDRIEEFTTFTQMLTKERDDSGEQKKKSSIELNEVKEQLASLKTNNAALANEIEESKKQLEDYGTIEADRAIKEELEFNLSKENNILREDLFAVQQSRDKMAGENAVLKKQLETAENLVVTTEKEKNEMKESTLQINSMIRQSEMNKSLKLSEFAEKQSYTINKTTQNLNELIASMEEMKSEVIELFEELKENKFMSSF